MNNVAAIKLQHRHPVLVGVMYGEKTNSKQRRLKPGNEAFRLSEIKARAQSWRMDFVVMMVDAG